MAITFIKQQQKQKYLILIFLAVLVITSSVVWYGFFRKPGAGSQGIATPPPNEININFDIFEKNQLLKDLRPFLEILPLKPADIIGRGNPFLSF